MNPKLKAKWIAALRSGKYAQVQGQLRQKPVGFCCLGVLCDISPEIEWDGEMAFFEKESGPDVEWDDSMLPAGFRRHVGISDEAQKILAEMNDGGSSFDEIADCIEVYL